MAVDLINDMSVAWEPDKYHNDYRETLQKWLDQQVRKVITTGRKAAKAAPSHDAVVDFVSLLKESMQQKTRKPTKIKRAQHKK